MKKAFPNDIILVIILTIISVICIITLPLGEYPINIISYILLAIFLPGYALIAAIYPLKENLGSLTRITESVMFSILLTLLFVLLVDYNIFGITLHIAFWIIGFLTIILSIDALEGYDKASKINARPVGSDFLGYEHIESKNYGKTKPVEENKKVQSLHLDQEKMKITKKIPSDENSNQKFVTKDLVLILLTTLLALAFVLVPKLNDTIIRTILGILFILFLPGYSLIAALFPKKNDLDGIERIALSFGLSIAVTPLIGLALNYTTYGIRLTPILIAVSAFTLIMVLIAYIRRRRVPEGEKFYVDFGVFKSSINNHFKGESKTSKVLSIILIFTILLAIATTAYVIVNPKPGETFTEFYILGSGGKASDYPTNLTVGQNASVIIGIVNHEAQTVNYQLVIKSNNTVLSNQKITVNNGNTKQIPYKFSLKSPGSNEIEFLLYKLPDNTNIYRSLHIYVNVT